MLYNIATGAKAGLITICSFILLLSLCLSCSDKEDVVSEPPPAAESTKPTGEVMMQTFYWDVPAGGTWWDVINGKLSSWQSAGVTMLWLPPVSKAQSGGFSMGYDPYDYFDFGKYDQHGTIETRFGSDTELASLMSNAKSKSMKLIADIVINHNSGGDLELSPYTNTSYYTKFMPKSGKFNRNYEHFHPNAVHSGDADKFGGFPDLCHDVEYVKDWLWRRADGVGKYYKNTLGFDGWRFDYVKGFSPNVVKEWNAAVGGLSIGEFFDGDVSLVNNWCTAANSAAFDFPLMFAMRDAFNGNNLSTLDGKGLIVVNPSKAYTFVANHDIDEITTANKLKAYAYILTSEGTPVIFYKDYESLLDKAKLNTLITINKTLAAGTTTKLLSSTNEYIFRRNGTPGLVAYFNNRSTDVTRKVQTTWANKTLKDYTGTNPDVSTDGSGYATLACKGSSYAVYAPK